MNYETRSTAADVRVEGRKIYGRPIVYGSDSQLITENGRSFIERFMPGSVSRAIQAGNLRALIDHDANRLLGTQQGRTLRVSEDAEGVLVEIDVPDTSYARDLGVLMDRGDIRGMSFSFRPSGPKGETWRREGDLLIREINEAVLGEFSPTPNPAYMATTAVMRSLDLFLASEEGTHAPTTEKKTAARPLLDAATEQASRILI